PGDEFAGVAAPGFVVLVVIGTRPAARGGRGRLGPRGGACDRGGPRRTGRHGGLGPRLRPRGGFGLGLRHRDYEGLAAPVGGTAELPAGVLGLHLELVVAAGAVDADRRGGHGQFPDGGEDPLGAEGSWVAV